MHLLTTLKVALLYKSNNIKATIIDIQSSELQKYIPRNSSIGAHADVQSNTCSVSVTSQPGLNEWLNNPSDNNSHCQGRI